MPYPSSPELRVKFWQNQIEWTRKQVKPLFDACNVLAEQYFNEPSTEREQNISEGFTDEEHVRRTKSGIIYGWIDQSLANMLDRAPTFQCFPENREAATRIDPSDPNSLNLAQGTSKIVNYRYRETKQLRVDERVAQDAFLFPYGVAKIGYTVDFDARLQEFTQPDVEMELDDPEDENLFLSVGQRVLVTQFHDHRAHLESHTQLLQSIELLLLPADQLEIVAAIVKDHIDLHKNFLHRKLPSANTNVKQESPFAVRWRPDMFLSDDMSSEALTDCRWIAFGWELPIDEVKANPAYSNTSNLEPTRWKHAPEKPEELDNDGFDIVRGWEIWAKGWPMGPNHFDDLLITIAEDHQKPLQHEDEWPYDRLDDYPAATVVYQTGIRRWFHKPPLLMGGGDTVQALVNEILDSYLYTVRKQKNLWLIDPDIISKDMVEDILSLPDGAVVEVPGLASEGANSIVPLPFHQVPPEKGELVSVLQAVFDRSVGTPQPVQLPKTDTATEASILEKRNTARENRRSVLLSEFQVDKAKKMWQLDSQYQPDQLFLLDKNADAFLEISPELAKGEYLFTMDVTSHSTALAVERSQWMDLMNLFAGLTPIMIQTFGLPPNLPEIARRLLVRGFNEKVVEEILPMLGQAAEAMANPQQPPITGQDRGAQFTDPRAEEANQANRAGRNSGRNIGPQNPATFKEDIPNQGRTTGAAERP